MLRRLSLALCVCALVALVPVLSAPPASATLIGNIPSGPLPCQESVVKPLRDVTADITNFIASIPTGGIAQLQNRCYHVEGNVMFNGKTNVTLAGNNAILKSYNDGAADTRADVAHLTVRNTHSSTVKNLGIVGAKPKTALLGTDDERETQHGIAVLANEDLLIDNVNVDWVWGDYVYIFSYPGVDPFIPTGITIQNSEFGDRAATGNTEFSSGRQGISINEARDVTISSNDIGHSGRSAIDIEPPGTQTISGVSVIVNHFAPQKLTWFANHGHGTSRINNLLFMWNTHERTLSVDSITPGYGSIDTTDPDAFLRHDYSFIGNTSSQAVGTGDCDSPPTDTMRFFGVRGIDIEANTQPMVANRCQMLLNVAYARDVSTSNNDLLNATTLARYITVRNYEECGNRIGNPLHAAPLSAGATAC